MINPPAPRTAPNRERTITMPSPDIRAIMLEHNCSEVEAIRIYNDKVVELRPPKLTRDDVFNYFCSNPGTTRQELERWAERQGDLDALERIPDVERVRQMINNIWQNERNR
jgi:hypothetical protein